MAGVQQRLGGVVRQFQLDLRLLAFDGVADDARQQFQTGQRLDHVILGAGADGILGHALVVQPGQHHQRRVRGLRLHAHDRLQSRGVGQAQIGQDALVLVLLRHAQAVGQAAAQVGLPRDLSLREFDRDQSLVTGIVLDDKQSFGRSGGSHNQGRCSIVAAL